MPEGFQVWERGESCLRGLDRGQTIDLTLEASISFASEPSRQSIECQPDVDKSFVFHLKWGNGSKNNMGASACAEQFSLYTVQVMSKQYFSESE